MWNLGQFPFITVETPAIVLRVDHRCTLPLKFQQQVCQPGLHADLFIGVFDIRAQPLRNVSVLTLDRFNVPVQLTQPRIASNPTVCLRGVVEVKRLPLFVTGPHQILTELGHLLVVLVEYFLHVLYPLLPVGYQGNNRPVEVVVSAERHERRRGVEVFGPQCLKEFSSVEGVLDGVIQGVNQHLANLRQVSCLDEDITDNLIASAQLGYILSEELANRRNVEVIALYQGVCAALVKPLRCIP